MNLYYEMPWELRTIVCVYGMSIMTAIVYITLKNAVTGREKRIYIPGTVLFFISALLLQGMADNGREILSGQDYRESFPKMDGHDLDFDHCLYSGII